jgi:hypothetical protein
MAELTYAVRVLAPRRRFRWTTRIIADWPGGFVKIYQIEISNLCNLTCSDCPHPRQERPKGLMSNEVFEKALELVVRCGQHVAYLHNFGEPLLHPNIASYVQRCVERGVTPSFFTNGVLINDQALAKLVEAGLRILCISEHTKGELRRIHQLIQAGGYPVEIQDTFRPIKSVMHDWAGQVKHRPAPGGIQKGPRSLPCLFEREKAAVVLWDGRVNVCCIDVEGQGVRGNVDDYLADPSLYDFRPIPLCDGCTLMRGEEDLS